MQIFSVIPSFVFSIKFLATRQLMSFLVFQLGYYIQLQVHCLQGKSTWLLPLTEHLKLCHRQYPYLSYNVIDNYIYNHIRIIFVIIIVIINITDNSSGNICIATSGITIIIIAIVILIIIVIINVSISIIIFSRYILI